jgi:hypothetical protein
MGVAIVAGVALVAAYLYANRMPSGTSSLQNPPTGAPLTLAAFGNTNVNSVGYGTDLGSQASVAAYSGMVAKDTAAIPIVGQVTGVFSQIAGLISAHHTQALKTEGDTLNYSDPLFWNRLQQIVAAFNAGQITQGNAVTLVDQALAEWDANVAHITSKPFAADGSGKCNAACFVRVNYILPAVSQVKGIIQSKGTATIKPIPAHATQSGTPGFYLTVN